MPAGAERVLAVDTSIAVPLVLSTHEAHHGLVAWRAGRPLALCGHALVETYAVLTRLPGASRLHPDDARRLLAADFAAPLAASLRTSRRMIEALAAAGVSGGAVYDGAIALVALQHDAVLATRDRRAEPTYRRLGVALEMVALPG